MATAMVFLLLVLLSSAAFTHSQPFSRTLSKADIGLENKKEKLSHLHFYFHDIVSGPHPSAIRVAAAPTTNSSRTGYGAVVMMDDPLTEGPDIGSKLVGRAQGIYAASSQEDFSYLMALNYVFVEGMYNGSTLSILGKNSVFDTVREMPVVGGSGVFRLARGYALAKTIMFDLKTGDAIVEYNVYVFHY
ncbi:OLC1v1035395C1 [Oldenlandia corymbosa var. corymbosa]|uniref:Dirigent protein n=1 Tax=Oldenlandia corymbosa var. corymbosa TaxID=529605 RepID=A0AAV1CSV7_OLDCO|nr:OLC1v1035395C1 [Oldenlandia corymbosa var. corymbosa]